MLPELVRKAGPTQFGGLPGRGTAHASLMIRLAQSIAAQHKLSFGALFLDVAQAFYRTIRELVISSQCTDEDIARIVKAADMPPEAMHRLAE